MEVPGVHCVRPREYEGFSQITRKAQKKIDRILFLTFCKAAAVKKAFILHERCYNCSKAAKMVKSGRNGRLIFTLAGGFLFWLYGSTNGCTENYRNDLRCLFLLPGWCVLCKSKKFVICRAGEERSCVCRYEIVCEKHGSCGKDCSCCVPSTGAAN